MEELKEELGSPIKRPLVSIMVSTTLIDKYVGLEELGDGIWRIYFRQKMLGYFDEKTLRIQDEIGRLKRNNV